MKFLNHFLHSNAQLIGDCKKLVFNSKIEEPNTGDTTTKIFYNNLF